MTCEPWGLLHLPVAGGPCPQEHEDLIASGLASFFQQTSGQGCRGYHMYYTEDLPEPSKNEPKSRRLMWTITKKKII